MIVGAAGCVRFLQKLPQCGLSLGRTLQEQKHPFCGKGIRHRAAVIFRLGKRMRVALQRHADPLIHRLRNPRARLRSRRAKADPESKKQNHTEENQGYSQRTKGMPPWFGRHEFP